MADTIVRSIFRKIQLILVRNKDADLKDLFEELYNRISLLIEEDLTFSIRLAASRLDEDEEDFEEEVKKQTERTQIGFYLPAIKGYADTLKAETEYFLNKGLEVSEYGEFIASPLTYLMDKNISTDDMKNTVPVKRGQNYSIKSSLKQLGTIALMAAFADTVSYGWRNGGVKYYIGFRNGNFPCELCDAYAGKLMPIENMVYPLHPNCICGYIPIYGNEVSD